MLRAPLLLVFAPALLALVGCPPPPPGDAGPVLDAGPEEPDDAGVADGGLDAGPGGACAEALPEQVLDGDARVTSEATLVALSEIACVTGDVIVELTLLDELTLPELTRVGGSMVVESNARLAGLQLGALKQVDGDLLFRDNPTLDDLTGLPLLTTIGGSVVIGGPLSFYGNGELTSLTGLESVLEVRGDVVIGNNPALSSLAGLDLTRVGGGLVIEESPALASLAELTGLAQTGGDLVVRAMPALATLTGLETLRTVGGDLVLGGRDAEDGNPELVSIEELVALTEVTGTLVVGHNEKLSQCRANALAQRLTAGGGVGDTFISANGPCTDAGP